MGFQSHDCWFFFLFKNKGGFRRVSTWVDYLDVTEKWVLLRGVTCALCTGNTRCWGYSQRLPAMMGDVTSFFCHQHLSSSLKNTDFQQQTSDCSYKMQCPCCSSFPAAGARVTARKVQGVWWGGGALGVKGGWGISFTPFQHGPSGSIQPSFPTCPPIIMLLDLLHVSCSMVMVGMYILILWWVKAKRIAYPSMKTDKLRWISSSTR